MKLWRSDRLIVALRNETHLVFTLAGERIGAYGPRSYSDEDDLWRTFQLVEGDRLLERTVIERRGQPEPYDEKVLATGLSPADDEATRALATRAFERLDGDLVDAASEAQRAALARVDRIAGARDDLNAGPLVERAQLALRSRVATWDDRHAASLLRTLIDLVHERIAAVEPFARGCLFACFEYSVPEVPAPPETPHAAFFERLTAHADKLDALANAQERVDANANAAAYGRAAEAIRSAAARLEPAE